ncbi:MAG TPA: serine/threonine-protein kinase [Gemmataceae bacterium]|nr:serine/threonine-protein kinase [Gemmataceae bacterium]
MSAEKNRGTGELLNTWDQLSEIISRFEGAWQGPQPPLLGNFLPPSGPQRLAALVELAPVDLEYRLKAGQTVRVEQYLRVYPELLHEPAAVLTLIEIEFRLRLYRREAVALQGYAQRFPLHQQEVLARLRKVQRELEDATQGSDPPVPAPAPAPARAAAGSVTDLVQLLRDGHLLNPVQLDKVPRDLQHRYSAAPAFVEVLLHWGWLTPYQAERLRDGRGRELLLGQYVILDVLGQGGMGQVFKARHRLMKRVVAVKTIRQERAGSSEALQRFYREIEASAQLAHPNIVTVHDAGQDGPTLYYAMEYVEGTDLGKLLRQRGPLEVGLACAYVRQAALGLQHAKGLYLWPLAGESPLKLLESRAKSKPRTIAVSPDGTYLVRKYPGAQHRLSLWTRNPLNERPIFPDLEGGGAGFLDKDRVLVVAGNALRIWSVTGKELQPLMGHAASATAVTFAPDGSRLLSAGDDDTLRLWDLEQLQPPRTLRGEKMLMRTVALTPDKRLALGYSASKGLGVFEVQTEQRRWLSVPLPPRQVLAVLPDNRHLLAAQTAPAAGGKEGESGSIALWDLETSKRVRYFGGTTTVHDLGLFPKKERWYAAFADGKIGVWRVDTWQEEPGWRIRADRLAFASDEKALFTIRAGQVSRWDLTKEPPVKMDFKAPEAATARSLALSPDGTILATIGQSGRLVVWQAATEKVLLQWAHPKGVNAVAFAPDSRHLATANGDGTIYILRLATP